MDNQVVAIQIWPLQIPGCRSFKHAAAALVDVRSQSMLCWLWPDPALHGLAVHAKAPGCWMGVRSPRPNNDSGPHTLLMNPS